MEDKHTHTHASRITQTTSMCTSHACIAAPRICIGKSVYELLCSIICTNFAAQTIDATQMGVSKAHHTHPAHMAHNDVFAPSIAYHINARVYVMVVAVLVGYCGNLPTLANITQHTLTRPPSAPTDKSNQAEFTCELWSLSLCSFTSRRRAVFQSMDDAEINIVVRVGQTASTPFAMVDNAYRDGVPVDI